MRLLVLRDYPPAWGLIIYFQGFGEHGGEGCGSRNGHGRVRRRRPRRWRSWLIKLLYHSNLKIIYKVLEASTHTFDSLASEWPFLNHVTFLTIFLRLKMATLIFSFIVKIYHEHLYDISYCHRRWLEGTVFLKASGYYRNFQEKPEFSGF